MEIFFSNFGWMAFNLALAFIGVALGYIFFSIKRVFLKLILFILWILFIPNTIYLVTDLQYLPGQIIAVGVAAQLLLALQYLFLAIIGVLTFKIGMQPVEKMLIKSKMGRSNILICIVMLNTLIAFGVVLGKMLRVQSWEVFTNPLKTFASILYTVNSPELIIFFIVFAILTNIIYFFKRKQIKLM